jgi:steroid delta-isomerase-like uncharacterized protein
MAEIPDVMIHQWFEELWNQGKEDTIDRLLAPDGKIHGLPTPDNQPLVGPDAFRPFFRRFRAAFPDIRVTIERAVKEDNLVAIHCRVTGTHLGDALGIPPTGRRVDFSGMCFARAAGPRFEEGWNVFDFLTCYQQLGVLPSLT